MAFKLGRETKYERFTAKTMFFLTIRRRMYICRCLKNKNL